MTRRPISRPLSLACLLVASSCDVSAPPLPKARSLDDAPPGVVGIAASGAPVCGDDLAATTFRFGLCTCEDIAFSTVLRVNEGGSAGTNGDFTSTGDSAISGSLVVGGDALPIGNHEIAGELRVQGDVTAAGDIDVDGDAFIGGNLTGFVTDVAGALHIPASSTVGIGASAASIVNEPINVELPCACRESDRVDVDGFIADARDNNDNAAIALAPDALIDLVQPKELALPPGRYFVDRIFAIAPLILEVSGPTALYVAGDLESVSVFEIHLQGADADLDVFVGGSLVATGDFEMGVEGGPPSSVRTYVAGSEDILLAGDLDFQGNLWAPNARLVAAGPLTVTGSLLVREIVEAGVIEVGWDASVVDGGSCDDDASALPEEGDDEPATCGSCEDCSNQACTDGVCGACESSLDCCAPLVCAQGQCVLQSG